MVVLWDLVTAVIELNTIIRENVIDCLLAIGITIGIGLFEANVIFSLGWINYYM